MKYSLCFFFRIVFQHFKVFNNVITIFKKGNDAYRICVVTLLFSILFVYQGLLFLLDLALYLKIPRVSHCRGNKGFIVINAGTSGLLNAYLNTGLPQGTYCDVISGNYVNGHCTGGNVTVASNGHAHFNIDSASTDPVVAIHIGMYV